MTATMDRLDDEVATTATDTLNGLLGRLNEQSVRPGKHFDAYVDVPWDEHTIEPTDPRWELGVLDPLGATAWYQAQPQEVRGAIGIHLVASKMKVGYFFEGVLKRGLLEHSTTLAAGSPELRYVYHEVIEEAQHSLMFQEFAGRAGHGRTGDGAVLSVRKTKLPARLCWPARTGPRLTSETLSRNRSSTAAVAVGRLAALFVLVIGSRSKTKPVAPSVSARR